MALKYYQALKNSYYQDPVDDWQDLMQASVNDTWEDTSTIRSINGQKIIGGTEYASESVQLNSVIEPKTGKDFGDNYRKIIYKDINVDNSVRFLGKYYQFDNSDWIVINTLTKVGTLSTAIVQRCNQYLSWYDEQGVFHKWSCIVDRSLSSTNFNYGQNSLRKGVIEIGADIVVIVQQNSETSKIVYNQRFIINGKAFQVKQINDYVSDTYMEIYMFQVQVQTIDDTQNNIADGKDSIQTTTNGTILLPNINEILLNQTINFSVYHYVKGVADSSTYNISINGGAENYNYTLNIVNGNNFTITNLLALDTSIEVVCTNKTNSSDVISKKIMLGGIW